MFSNIAAAEHRHRLSESELSAFWSPPRRWSFTFALVWTNLQHFLFSFYSEDCNPWCLGHSAFFFLISSHSLFLYGHRLPNQEDFLFVHPAVFEIFLSKTRIKNLQLFICPRFISILVFNTGKRKHPHALLLKIDVFCFCFLQDTPTQLLSIFLPSQGPSSCCKSWY